MIATLGRYWIALLVILLVGLHATIMAVVRYQAIQAQQKLSCEVDLGTYQVGRKACEEGIVQLRLHAVVPHEYRVQGQQTFEAHRWELRQSIEELLRQTEPSLLEDASLSDLKKQVLDVLVQSVGESLVSQVLITELAATQGKVLVFTRTSSHDPHSPHESHSPPSDHSTQDAHSTVSHSNESDTH
jgi:hypothetical protein